MNNETVKPEVGMPATFIFYTDRHAGTIVKVTKTQVHVQRDKEVRVDSNGMSDSQRWISTPDKKGEITIFRKTKRGYQTPKGGIRLGIGYRKSFYDCSY